MFIPVLLSFLVPLGIRAKHRWVASAALGLLLMDVEVYLLFRFVTGLCGAAFLSVAGGSVSDMFSNAAVAK